MKMFPLAAQIFMQALRQLFGNFGAALRLSAVAVLVLTLFGYVFLPRYPFHGLAGVAGRMIAIAALSGCIWAWIAVGWHRYILAGEPQGRFFPNWAPCRLMAYIWRALRLTVLCLLVAIPVTIPPVVAVLWLNWPDIQHNGAAVTPGMDAVIQVFADWAIAWTVLRFGSALPAAALGLPMTLRGAFAATRKARGAIFLLSIGVSVLDTLAHRVIRTVPTTFNDPVVRAENAVSFWLVTMLGIALLNVVYARYAAPALQAATREQS